MDPLVTALLDLAHELPEFPQLVAAREIIREYFTVRFSVGVLRLIVGAQDAGLERSSIRVDEMVASLKDLFDPVASVHESTSPPPL